MYSTTGSVDKYFGTVRKSVSIKKVEQILHVFRRRQTKSTTVKHPGICKYHVRCTEFCTKFAPLFVKRTDSPGPEVGPKVASTDLHFWLAASEGHGPRLPSKYHVSWRGYFCSVGTMYGYWDLMIVTNTEILSEIVNIWCGLVDVRIIWPFFITEAE
jgi:hypothetical protein